MDEKKTSGSFDETKGRIRSAYGELTGDESQKRKGSVEKGQGKVKEFVDNAGDKIKGAFDKDDKKY